jgi:hypothetical protein
MKLNRIIQACCCLAALPLAAMAQTTVENVSPPSSDWGPHMGSREFTIGANGSSNRSLDSSGGGGAASLGYYLSNHWEVVLRQTANYSNPAGHGGNVWTGETAGALDFDLAGQGALRPFVGANVGWNYGSHVSDSGAAGLEAGLKFYIAPRTFIVPMANYGWLFHHGRAIASRFSTGIWNWSLGMGFNF